MLRHDVLWDSSANAASENARICHQRSRLAARHDDAAAVGVECAGTHIPAGHPHSLRSTGSARRRALHRLGRARKDLVRPRFEALSTAKSVDVTHITPAPGSNTLTIIAVTSLNSGTADYFHLSGNVRFKVSGMVIKSSNVP